MRRARRQTGQGLHGPSITVFHDRSRCRHYTKYVRGLPAATSSWTHPTGRCPRPKPRSAVAAGPRTSRSVTAPSTGVGTGSGRPTRRPGEPGPARRRTPPRSPPPQRRRCSSPWCGAVRKPTGDGHGLWTSTVHRAAGGAVGVQPVSTGGPISGHDRRGCGKGPQRFRPSGCNGTGCRTPDTTGHLLVRTPRPPVGGRGRTG
jgi:hypothetical protein